MKLKFEISVDVADAETGHHLFEALVSTANLAHVSGRGHANVLCQGPAVFINYHDQWRLNQSKTYNPPSQRRRGSKPLSSVAVKP